MRTSEEELLNILCDEMDRAIGWDNVTGSEELQSQREIALDFYKGDINEYMPHGPNRSGAKDSSVADTIEQVLPQMMEIFLDEDVASFRPRSAADIAAAEQETDFVNHVIFRENDGFMLLYDAFKDAFLTKTGYWVWHWDDGEDNTQVFENQTLLDIQNLTASLEQEQVQAQQMGLPVTSVENVEQNEDGTYNFTLREPKEGRVCIKTWLPEDVSVSEDTLKLGSGTYCGFRTRVRRQELLEDGYPKETVENLPSYSSYQTDMAFARDTVGEQDSYGYGSQGVGDLDMVEVQYHYLRKLEGNEMVLYYVVTAGDSDSPTILDVKEVETVDAAMITPFPQPHRFYGLSLADKMIETAKIKTALLRSAMDSAFFAQSQRYEVVEGGMNKWTMSDILNNSPGSPIRVRSPQTVVPLQPGSVGFDYFNALEFMSVQGEQRSGVVRASMGLNPDTLHDTSSGMLAMKSMADLRVRFFARVFAETGFKDMCIGVHDCLRRNSSMAKLVRLRGKWVPVNPSSWSLRDDMDIEIGNAGGRDRDIANLREVVNLQGQAMQAQGGAEGPLTGQQYQLYTVKRLLERMGFKSPEQFFPEPTPAQPQQPQDPAQSPEAMKLQAELQSKQSIEQAKLQAQIQIETAKAQAQAQVDLQKAQYQAQLDAAKLQADQANADRAFQLSVEQAQAELRLKEQAQVQEQEIAVLKLQTEATLREQQVSEELALKARVAQLEAELEIRAQDLQAQSDALGHVVSRDIADLTQPVNLNVDIQPGGNPG